MQPTDLFAKQRALFAANDDIQRENERLAAVLAALVVALDSAPRDEGFIDAVLDEARQVLRWDDV